VRQRCEQKGRVGTCSTGVGKVRLQMGQEGVLGATTSD
jgi:hypothetical protein